MSAIPLSREEIVDRLAKVFRDGGYEAASLTLLARATGLGKASLYYHFPQGKEQMAMAVLEQSQERFDTAILQPLASDAKPVTRITRMIHNIDEYYCQGNESCLLGVLAMSATPAAFHQHIRKGLLRWVDALAQVLEAYGLPPRSAKLRAEGAVCMVEGALLLSRGTGDSQPFRRILGQLKAYLLAPAQSGSGLPA